MQERANSTRRAVLKAAAEAFEANGFAATSINDIVRAAGVTKGALYFHFPSKESLAEAVISEQIEWRDNQQWTDSQGIQRLIDITYRFADAVQTDPFIRASIRLALEYSTFATPHSAPYTEWIAQVRTLLDDADKAGELVEGLDLDSVSRLVAGSISGLHLLSEATADRKDLLELIHTMWAALIPAFARPDVLPRLSYGPDRAAA